MGIQELGISNPTKDAGVESTHLRQFYMDNTTNSNSAMQQLKAKTGTPVIADGLVLSHIERDVSPLGNGSTDWLGTARYSHESSEKSRRQQRPFKDGQSEETFSGTFAGTLQSTKIIVALSQEKYGADAPDFGNAINVKISDGVPTAQGTDILVPMGSYKKKVVKKMPTFDVQKADALLGTMNDAGLAGNKYDPGEALFVSYEAQKRGDLWHINYGWSTSRNKNDFPNFVDEGIIAAPNDITKLGWEYLWPLYGVGKDAAKARPIPKLIGVYVAQVYKWGDHGDLPGVLS